MPALQFDYVDIIDILQEQSCALFLGPRLFKTSSGLSIEEAMWEELGAGETDHPLIRKYYKEDGFILLQDETMRRRLVRKIKRFYEKDHPETEAFLQKIAQLPFHLIFNMSPHNLMCKAFDQAGMAYEYDFYHKTHPYKPFVAPSKEKPLIYNLLGDINEADSIILTYSDLFSYLESIFAGRSMSPELRKTIQDTDTFIFLGLPYDKWYMQLLLRTLYHISSKLGILEQYASHPGDHSHGGLFEDEFKIKFMPDNGVNFVEELFKVCEKEGQLKTKGEETEAKDYQAMLDEVQDRFISTNEWPEGIKILMEIYKDHEPKSDELKMKVEFLHSQFNELDEIVRDGTALESDKSKFTGVKKQLIELLSKTKDLIE